MEKLQRSIVLASDHAGLALKNVIIQHLKDKKLTDWKIEDVGAYNLEKSDYPDFAAEGAKKIQKTKNIGIFVCGTGTGICFSANKFKGIRASICNNYYCARQAIKKDFPNVIAMGERVVGEGVALEIVDYFLQNVPEISEEKLKELEEIENENLLN
jgi:ribose 5-phosphate isomerase B